MEEHIICDHCGIKQKKSYAEQCECGSCYCSFHCMVDSLHKVGIMQHTFDEMDRCGKCAVEKLKVGKLTFPGQEKHLNRLLAPHLLMYVMGEVTKPRRKKKVSENQLSLF